MKTLTSIKALLILACVACSISAVAQETPVPPAEPVEPVEPLDPLDPLDPLSPPCGGDTDRLSFSNFDLLVIEKRKCPEAPRPDDTNNFQPKKKSYARKFSNWSGLYVGVNGYMTSSGSFDMGKENEYLQLDYARCMTLGLNFIDIKMKIVPSHVGLTTGLGIQWNRYGFKNNYTLMYNNDSIFGMYDSVVTFSKNRLNAWYLQVPLLLEFKTHKDSKRGFHFWAGAIGAYRIGSKVKQDYELTGVNTNEIEVRTKGHYHLNPLLLYATFGIGYGKHFTLFANYGLNTLFEKNRGPGVVPFTIGIKLD